VRVAACGVCHTELDEIEGRLAPSSLPRVLGHQVVGRVEAVGAKVADRHVGDRVGVAWIFRACGVCAFCTSGRENLCERFEATGRDANGGYAELMTAPAAFTYSIPSAFSDVEAAPLLCAGAIGYRSLAMTHLEDGAPLGLTGFGASAHLVMRLARSRFPRSAVYVFARDADERAFARELGATWTGDTDDRPPVALAAIIDTTPVWRPIVRALACLAPGGRLVINAIRKERGDQAVLGELDYPTHLWREKSIVSVANVTREDVRQFLEIAAAEGIKPEVEQYRLEEANEALVDLKSRRVRGGKVLVI
jgi:propanol-preferring alcohol dehydrogenase